MTGAKCDWSRQLSTGWRCGGRFAGARTVSRCKKHVFVTLQAQECEERLRGRPWSTGGRESLGRHFPCPLCSKSPSCSSGQCDSPLTRQRCFGTVSSLPVGSVSRQPAPVKRRSSRSPRDRDNTPVCFTLAHSTAVPPDNKDHAPPQSSGSKTGLLTSLILRCAQCGGIFRVLTFSPLALAEGPPPTLGISSPTGITKV